jgi:hypothetical protein
MEEKSFLKEQCSRMNTSDREEDFSASAKSQTGFWDPTVCFPTRRRRLESNGA